MNKIGYLQEKRLSSDLVCHYTTLPIGIEHILASGQLRFGPLAETDDPFEYNQLKFFMIGTGLPKNGIQEQLPIVDQRINNIRSNSKIGCFCADEWQDDYGEFDISKRCFAKSRMWSQYGDSQKGLCFVFSKTVMADLLSRKKEMNPSLFIKDRLVDYITYRELTAHNKIIGNKLEKMTEDGYSKRYVEEHFEDLYFRKAEDYSGEKEYRIVVYEEAEKYFYLEFERSLRAVVMGDRTPEVYYRVVWELCSIHNAELYKLRWYSGRLRLDRIHDTP